MRIKQLLVGALAVVSTVSCGTLLDPAAAIVSGDKITTDEVQSAVDEFTESPEFLRLAEQGDADALTREFEQTYLSQLIRRAILTPEARERGIEITEDEVQTQLDDIRAEFATPNAFEEALREQGLTLDQLRELVGDSALEEELRAAVTADLAPTEADLEAYYEDNIDRFSETEAQHILVDQRALATTISQQLRGAPRSDVAGLFRTLAREHSTDKSNKATAGKLGFFSPGAFVPEFEAGADELKIGEVSEPVQTEFGWHVIRVTDRRRLPFEEVRDQIQIQLSGEAEDQAWESWVRSAYVAADVEVNPRYGEFNLDTQRVEDASPRTIPGAEETPAVVGSPEPIP
jgi:foldase protein PrsA